jgi:hypothetical protein
MLNQSINITFGDELVFKCAECPDPAKRSALLELCKDAPDCTLCGKNVAAKEVPHDVVLYPGEPVIKSGARLCFSCYAGVDFTYKQQTAEQWQKGYEKMEQDYADGKIPYSMLVDAKEKYVKENAGTIIGK